MKLKFIGNGSAFNVSMGNTSAYYKENDKIIFIDFGENIFERVLKLNLLENIKKVYVAITHLHSDHVGSLASFIFYNFYKKGIKTHLFLNQYDDKGEKLLELLRIQGVSGDFIELANFKMDNPFTNLMECQFEKVTHYAGMDSYAINLKFFDNSNIYFSGDTNDIGYVKRIVQKLSKNDEFYCDTCRLDYEGNPHLYIGKLIEIVPKEKKGNIYCIHLDNEELEKRIKENNFNVIKCE